MTWRRNNIRLRRLESKAIHIMREAAFHSPVVLYSIGKDSSAMLHIVQRPFGVKRTITNAQR
jgi:sulfate adenylyltransferase subunit 2